jgi:Holliday junction resolvase hjc
MPFREWMLKLGDRERARERKERSRANRTRSADLGEFFENEVWLLLDMMGFDELNPRAFRLDITPEGYGSQTKQVDILARWGKEVLVIECKASENERVGLDRKDLSDLHEKRPRMLRSLHAEYGDCQVSFVFWLKNINPIERDIDDADRFEISFLDYEDFKEYIRTGKLINAGSKFQLLADLYGPKGKGICWSRRTPAITGKIAGRTFYFFMAGKPVSVLRWTI